MSNCTSDYAARTYNKGDETELTQLFNRIYTGFAGFVPRTPEYWLWCCLNRPDVEAEGIVIVESGKQVVGYGVVGKTGNIWELCYDSAYNGEEIVSTILECALNYVENSGADSVNLNAPTSDQLIRKLCSKFGFAETQSSHMFLSVVDFPQFIYALLNSKKDKLKDYNEILIIKLKNSPSWSEANVTIALRKGNISVMEGAPDEPDIVVEADSQTIVSCLLGTRGLSKAFLSSQLKVKPFWKSFKILKLFSLLEINDPWFSPRADFG